MVSILVAILLPHALAQGQAGVATISAANFRNLVAPDSIVASFGAQLATGIKVAETVPLPTELLGTVVTVTDASGGSYVAPLLFVSPAQINYIIPAQAKAGTATVSVRSGGGQTSTGSVQIAIVAPSIFTANQNGVGVPAALVLRVLANGQQETESASVLGPDQTFVPRAISLGPLGERVFLILFLSGLRNAPNTDGSGNNGSAENVKVTIGGVSQPPLYAGPQGAFEGLDQINLEIPRTLLDASLPGSKQIEISVKVNGYSDSNPVEIALAPPAGGTPLLITDVSAPERILVNSVIQLTGTGIATIPEKNKVSFGEGTGDPRSGEVKTASTTQLAAVVPFGAQSGAIAVNSDGKRWTSDAPVRIRTSFSAVLKDTEGQLLPPVVGARICFPDCATQGALTTTLQPGGWFVLPDPPVGARRVFVIEPVGQSTQLPFNRTLISSPILVDRDNHLPQDVFVQAIYGPSGLVGTPSGFAGSRTASAAAVSAPELDLAIEGFRFSVPAGADATFPDGSKAGVLTLTPVKNSLTPVPPPADVFSTAVVQISPFGTKLAPGGKLIFPNRDNLPTSPQPTLYKYDLNSAAFIDTGIKGVVSTDRKTIETPSGAITEASIYFVGVPQQTTTIAGRVLDSDGLTPVRGAVVLASGRQVLTDGNGGFSLKDVALGALLDSGATKSGQGSNRGTRSSAQSVLQVSASYLRPSGRTDTASGETTSIVVGGITNLDPLMLSAANSNQPPTILASGYSALYVTQTSNLPVLVVDPDAGQSITGLSVSGATFASIINNGGGAFALRMTPGAAEAGSYTLSLTATDAGGASASVEVAVLVLPLPVANPLSIVTTEDTPKGFSLTGSDPGGAALSFSLVTQPAGGSLSGSPPNLTYVPTSNFSGNDSFTFKVTNGVVESLAATVTIKVEPVNDAPVLQINCSGPTRLIVGSLLECMITASDADGGQNLNISADGLPQGATFNAGTGQFTWTPSLTQAGSFAITFVVRDEGDPPLTDARQLLVEVLNPVPVLSLISPTSAMAGSPDLVLTVTGSGFVPASQVQWNGSPRATTFVNAGSLTALVQAADLLNAGFASVTVLNSQPGGGTSGASTFAINNPVPIMGGTVPASVLAGGIAFSLTVNGSGFVPTSEVRWNGSPRTTTFDNSNQLTASIPASDIAVVGVANVTVFSPGPGGGTSGVSVFSIDNPTPIITGTLPASVLAGGPNFPLTVNGSNFVAGSTVRVAGSDRGTLFVNGGELTASILAADIANGGSISLTVVNPTPGNPESAPFLVTINNPVPILGGTVPASALAGGIAFSLTVNGSGFVPTSEVRWNGSPRTTTFDNSNQLTASIPASDIAVVGVANVTVFSPGPGGGTSGVSVFSIDNPTPIITGTLPASVLAGGPNFPLTVNGSNFVAGSTVRVAGSDRGTLFVNGGELTASILAADIANAGSISLTVVNPTPGNPESAPFLVTINNPVPILGGTVPASALAGGIAFSLTVNGSGFVPTSEVRWNGSPRTTTFDNSNQLTASIPASDIAVVGVANVTVFSPGPGGGTSGVSVFSIDNPTPIITGTLPASVLAGGPNFPLTVNGSNFVAGSTVRVAGSDRGTLFVNGGELTASILAADIANAGSISLTVVNPTPGNPESAPFLVTINNPVPILGGTVPASALAGGIAFSLTVNGSGFVPTSEVRWNGSPRTTTFDNSNQLTASIPASDIAVVGVANVTVFSPGPGGGTSGVSVFSIDNPTPIITGTLPASVLAGGPNFPLTVNGSNFVAGSTVRVAGSDRGTLFVNGGELTASILAADIANAGSISLTVVNPTPGNPESAPFLVTINNPVPILGGTVPASALAGGIAFSLTVNGSGFVPTSEVRWNGSPRTTTFDNSNQLTASIPASDIAVVGVANVTVFSPGPGGGTSGVSVFSIDNPTPIITGTLPASVLAGGPNFPLTVNGSNFVAGSTVRVAGSDRGTLFVNGGELTASILASDIANAGSISLTVVNPTPGNPESAPFLVTINNPVPILGGTVPASALAGGIGFSLTVNGSGFVPTSEVRWNGSPRTTTFDNSNQLTASIPASDIAVVGVANVTVFSPGPGGGTSGVSVFSIDNPTPIITGTLPASVLAGGPNFPLTVNGSNFVAGSTVRVAGSDRGTLFVNGGELTASILAADIANGGSISLTVVNPTPGNPESAPFLVTVNNPVPVLGSLVPDNTTTGGAEVPLTLIGSNFVPSSVVLWNGSTRTTTFVSSTQLGATIPNSDFVVGTVANVTVSNPTPGGGTSASQPFTVNNPVPGAIMLTPNSGFTGGPGFTLTVDGSNFVPNSVVRWDGNARTTTYVSPAQVTAVIPATDLQTTGMPSVTVFNPTPSGGLSLSATFTITNPAPATSNLNPSVIASGSGPFILTVNGSNFVPTSEVLWDGTPKATTFVNSGQLTAQILAADVASVANINVSVSSPPPGGGTSAPPLVFTVGNPIPSVTTLSPPDTFAGPSDFTLTVNGLNFVPTSQILFDGVPRNTTFGSPTQLSSTIATPDTIIGKIVNVTVFNPAPAGGTSNIVTWAINNPAPVTTLVESDPLVVGGGPVDFNVLGTGFVSTTVGYWNGNPRPTNVVNSTELVMTLPPSDLTMVATGVPVYFVNPAPGGGQSVTTFHDVVNPQPILTMLSPDSVLAGGPAFTITATGTGFVDGIVFKWNDTPRPTTFVDSTTCTAMISAADIATAGNTEISVSNPPPGGALNSNVINFGRLAPLLTMLNPNTIVAGQPGFPLTVIGENFANGVQVKWGGSARPTNFVSATECTAMIPASDLVLGGTIVVSVTNPGSVDSSNTLDFMITGGPIGPGSPPSAEEFSTSWNLTSPINVPRSGPTATRLANGHVLVAGGRAHAAVGPPGFPMSAAEFFDTDKGEWRRLPSMRFSRAEHSATFVATDTGGYVLVVGGDGVAASTAEVYDPVATQWLDIASPLFAHTNHSATVLADGRIMIAGGEDELGAVTTNVEIFDPRLETWIRTGALNTPRSGHGAILLADGRVLVVGGSSEDGPISSVETYDPLTELWSSMAPLSIARSGHTTTLLRDGRVLVVGGGSPDAASTAEVFDPVTGGWTVVGRLGTPRFGHSAVVLADGSVLIGGGQTAEGTTLDACEAFDPQRGLWSTAPHLNQSRTAHAALVLDDGRVLVAGGQGAVAGKPKP